MNEKCQMIYGKSLSDWTVRSQAAPGSIDRTASR
jgi:hypothetical protein